MAIKSDRAYRQEYMAILKACSDFGFSDTEDVPLSAIVRSAFQVLRDAQPAAPQPPASTPRQTVELVETLIQRIGAGIRLNLPMWEIRRSVHDILALPDPPSAIPPPPQPTDEVQR